MVSTGTCKKVSLTCTLLLSAGLALAATTGMPPKSTGKKQVISGKHVRYKKARKSWKRRGQQAIDKDRAREIQLALIRQNYLQGQPSGIWDTRSKNAMQKFQADRGWQTKVVPDARALIELGLGPKHENIINPETAMTPSVAISPVNAAAAASQQH